MGFDSPYTYAANQPGLFTDRLGLWPDCAWLPFTASAHPCGYVDRVASTLEGRNTYGKYVVKPISAVWVNLGRGASMGSTDDLADSLSPGASCKVRGDGFVARTFQLGGFAATVYVTAGGSAGIEAAYTGVRTGLKTKAASLINRLRGLKTARAAEGEGGPIGQLKSIDWADDTGSIGRGTPRSNAAQNKQFNDAIKTAERQLGRTLSKDERSAVHREISGQDYGFHDIVDEVLGMFGGGK
jgi:hypothetical protein